MTRCATSFVLHDVFGMPFAEVARVVGRTPQAVRQLASRARRHVADTQTRFEVDPGRHDQTVWAFVGAAASGDLASLIKVLDPDVVLASDGGGQVSAARRPVVGQDRVARFIVGLASTREADAAPVLVNGALGLMLLVGDRVHSVVSLTVRDQLVVRVDSVLNPHKLMRVDSRGLVARTTTQPGPHSDDLGSSL